MVDLSIRYFGISKWSGVAGDDADDTREWKQESPSETMTRRLRISILNETRRESGERRWL